MSRVQQKSLLVALVQLAVLGAVGAKFLIDRANYPRVWVQTVPIDPDLPIRGRYVRLNAVVEHPAPNTGDGDNQFLRTRLQVRDDKLVAVVDTDAPHSIRWRSCGLNSCWTLERALAYFIPEHVRDPSRRESGEELWVEVSVPPYGPPRPIQLGVKKNGVLQPLDVTAGQ